MKVLFFEQCLTGLKWWLPSLLHCGLKAANIFLDGKQGTSVLEREIARILNCNMSFCKNICWHATLTWLLNKWTIYSVVRNWESGPWAVCSMCSVCFRLQLLTIKNELGKLEMVKVNSRMLLSWIGFYPVTLRIADWGVVCLGSEGPRSWHIHVSSNAVFFGDTCVGKCAYCYGHCSRYTTTLSVECLILQR